MESLNTQPGSLRRACMQHRFSLRDRMNLHFLPVQAIKLYCLEVPPSTPMIHQLSGSKQNATHTKTYTTHDRTRHLACVRQWAKGVNYSNKTDRRSFIVIPSAVELIRYHVVKSTRCPRAPTRTCRASSSYDDQGAAERCLQSEKNT